MGVQYLIAIVPPQQYSERIISFQNKLQVQPIVEPHITIKAQGGLTADLSWIKKSA